MVFAGNLLAAHNYKCVNITEENYFHDCEVEYHVYHNDQPDTIIESRFGLHKDNYGGTNYNVHTCIIYLENTFESGGELYIVNNKKEEAELARIKPKPNLIVLMAGDVYHNITPVKGIGLRRCVVIQIKQLTDTKDTIDR